MLNQTAAVVLATAVCDLFPDVQIVGGQGGDQYFYYDLVFPFEFQKDFLPLIEERMRLIVREKRTVRSLEMMPSNAATMMQHRGQNILAERLSEIDRALVSMCQIGEFIAFCPYTIQEALSIPFLKICEGYLLPIAGQKIMRIVGSAALDKETLKAVVKQPLPACHLSLSREMGMFEPMEEFWLWRPKGEFIRQQLIDWWRQEYRRQNFSLISSPASLLGGEEAVTRSHREYFLRSGESKIAEVTWLESGDRSDPTLGLFSTGTYFADRSHLFCTEEKLLEECISSLRFIFKIPKILGFEFEIVLAVSNAGTHKMRSKGLSLFQQVLEQEGLDYTVEKTERAGLLASLELRMADALGRRWTGPFLRIPETGIATGKGCMLIRSAFGSFETVVALLLEKRGGWLPLWLAPEQVRILIVSSPAKAYADEVLQTLKTQGLRMTVEGGEDKLKTQVYKAIQEKVPCVVLLGEREVRAKTLTVRWNGEIEEQNLTLNEFCMRLKAEMGSGHSELTN